MASLPIDGFRRHERRWFLRRPHATRVFPGAVGDGVCFSRFFVKPASYGDAGCRDSERVRGGSGGGWNGLCPCLSRRLRLPLYCIP